MWCICVCSVLGDRNSLCVDDIGDKENQQIVQEGLLHCKLTLVDGKVSVSTHWQCISLLVLLLSFLPVGRSFDLICKFCFPFFPALTSSFSAPVLFFLFKSYIGRFTFQSSVGITFLFFLTMFLTYKSNVTFYLNFFLNLKHRLLANSDLTSISVD